MLKRCKSCNSIWVCWNWFHQIKSELQRLNPHLNIESDWWGHECWDCGNCQMTDYEVKNGIPYILLKELYKLRNYIHELRTRD